MTMSDLTPPPPPPLGVTPPVPPAPVLPAPPQYAPPRPTHDQAAFDAANNALLYEINSQLREANSTVKSIHRLLLLFAAALAIWMLLAVFAVALGTFGRSSSLNSDAYVQCVLEGRTNCR